MWLHKDDIHAVFFLAQDLFDFLEFLQLGLCSNWFGLACPHHCGSSTFRALALCFLLGNLFGFFLGLSSACYLFLLSAPARTASRLRGCLVWVGAWIILPRSLNLRKRLVLLLCRFRTLLGVCNVSRPPTSKWSLLWLLRLRRYQRHDPLGAVAATRGWLLRSLLFLNLLLEFVPCSLVVSCQPGSELRESGYWARFRLHNRKQALTIEAYWFAKFLLHFLACHGIQLSFARCQGKWLSAHHQRLQGRIHFSRVRFPGRGKSRLWGSWSYLPSLVVSMEFAMSTLQDWVEEPYTCFSGPQLDWKGKLWP